MSRFISNNYRLYLYSSLIFDILTVMIALFYSHSFFNGTGNDDVLLLLIKLFALLVIANRFSNFFFKLRFFSKLINTTEGKDDYYPDEALMKEIIDISEEEITQANSTTKSWVKFNLFMSIPSGIFFAMYIMNALHSSPKVEIASILVLIFTVAELFFYRTVLANIRFTRLKIGFILSFFLKNVLNYTP